MRNSITNSKRKVYATPRISLKMLCEYVNASPSRRSTIIKNSCEVPVFIARRYNLANEIITSYLTDNKNSIDWLNSEISRILSQSFRSENEKDMALLSAEAVTAFSKDAKSISKIFEAFVLEAVDQMASYKLTLETVDVSIKPDLLLKDENGNIIGFIKLYFSKETELNQNTADLITCLGREYFKEMMNLNLLERNCLVLDVFRGELYSAPKSFKKRMSDIYASCREIADRWVRFI